MDVKKNSFITQCYKVSNDCGISKVQVSSILSAFIDSLKNDIIQGVDIHLIGLARVSVFGNAKSVTLAYSVKDIADRLGISYVTCMTVVNYYLKYLKAELKRGMNVDIRSIFSIHAITDDSNNIVTYHSSLAEGLKSSCPNARVHTCKYLRGTINDR